MTSPIGGIDMKRILIYTVLIFFIFLSTSTVYAQVQPEENYLKDISDYYIVDQTLISEDNSTLIPRGAIQGAHDVYEIQYEYEVIVKQGKEVYALVEDLWFSRENVNVEDLVNVFDFEFDYNIVETLDYHEHFFKEAVVAERVVITLSISMIEPESYELAKELMSGQLSFEVYFFAA